LWREISDLGWSGIAIDEAYGGQGLGMVELVILCEELGHACAPTPFLSNAAAGLFIGSGSDEQRQRWLPGIASGEALGAAAFTPDAEAIVPDAEGATVLVLPQGDDGMLVERSAADVKPIDMIDSTRSYARVEASDGDLLSDACVRRGGDRVMVAVSAELTGVAQRAMEMAVEHAKEREQFGRPIGSYQAVSHRCAEMLLDTEEARSLTYYAAWTANAEPESLSLAASMAKARASEAAWHVTASALQVLGGIGFTWEHDLHFLLKRARVTGELMGPARQHRDRVADLVGLRAEAGVA
jgi:alkylation response protein AidB-like acyl-CoA dehydrogenase